MWWQRWYLFTHSPCVRMVVKEDCTHYCEKSFVQDTGRASRAATQKLEFTEDKFVDEQPQFFCNPKNPAFKKKPTK